MAQVRIGEKEYTPETERSGKPLSVNSWNISLVAFAYYVPILVNKFIRLIFMLSCVYSIHPESI